VAGWQFSFWWKVARCARLNGSTGLHRDAILRLLVVAGQRCEAKMDRIIRNVPATDVQADEIWGFIGKKEKNKGPEEANDDTLGDCYTWVAMGDGPQYPLPTSN
jgi:hypothetical protein